MASFIFRPEKRADPLACPAFRFRLEELGLSVSTGPVMDYRIREEICVEPQPGTVPLLYPAHFGAEGLQWPKPGSKKPNAIRCNERTRKWLIPKGYYTLVRRFSAKEERAPDRGPGSGSREAARHDDWHRE